MARAAQVTLHIEQNTGLNFTIVWKDCNGNIIDPSSYTFTMKFRTTKESATALATLTNITATSRIITVDIPATQLNLDFSRAWYSIRLTKSGAEPIRLMEGPVINNKEVSD